MALAPIEHPTEQTDMLTMRIDTTSPAARKALQTGLLEAKNEAYNEARKLLRLGRPLLLAVIGVSFLHIFDTVSTYKPESVDALIVPAFLHHITEAALVLSIDAVLAYFIAATNVARLAGAKPRTWAMWFFIVLTFALNMAYMVRYAPHIAEGFRSTALAGLDTFFVFALSAFVPAAILATEYASHLIKTARLKLLVETRALQEMTGGHKPDNAAESNNGAKPVNVTPAIGGRRQTYSLPDVHSALAGELASRELVTRADLKAAIGCGDSTIDKLLKQATDVGSLEPTGNGTYRVLANG